MNNMDWKEFKVEPEAGMFEKIQRKVRVRRAWRIGGIGAGVVSPLRRMFRHSSAPPSQAKNLTAKVAKSLCFI